MINFCRPGHIYLLHSWKIVKAPIFNNFKVFPKNLYPLIFCQKWRNKDTIHSNHLFMYIKNTCMQGIYQLDDDMGTCIASNKCPVLKGFGHARLAATISYAKGHIWGVCLKRKLRYNKVQPEMLGKSSDHYNRNLSTLIPSKIISPKYILKGRLH